MLRNRRRGESSAKRDSIALPRANPAKTFCLESFDCRQSLCHLRVAEGRTSRRGSRRRSQFSLLRCSHCWCSLRSGHHRCLLSRGVMHVMLMSMMLVVGRWSHRGGSWHSNGSRHRLAHHRSVRVRISHLMLVLSLRQRIAGHHRCPSRVRSRVVTKLR